MVDAGGDAAAVFLLPAAFREWATRRRLQKRDRSGWSLRTNNQHPSGWELTKTVVGGARDVTVSLWPRPSRGKLRRQIRQLRFMVDPSHDLERWNPDVVVLERIPRVHAGEVLTVPRPPGMRCTAVVVQWTADDGDDRALALTPKT